MFKTIMSTVWKYLKAEWALSLSTATALLYSIVTMLLNYSGASLILFLTSLTMFVSVMHIGTLTDEITKLNAEIQGLQKPISRAKK